MLRLSSVGIEFVLTTGRHSYWTRSGSRLCWNEPGSEDTSAHYWSTRFCWYYVSLFKKKINKYNNNNNLQQRQGPNEPAMFSNTSQSSRPKSVHSHQTGKNKKIIIIFAFYFLQNRDRHAFNAQIFFTWAKRLTSGFHLLFCFLPKASYSPILTR